MKLNKIFVLLIMTMTILCLSGCNTPTTIELSGNIDKQVSNANSNIRIVTSLEDVIEENSAWCGTFNLIWNDLRDIYAKQDIDFGIPSDIVSHLNAGTFTVDDLSENSYYKTHGIPTTELKAEIKKAIKDKFDEESDILDEFDWSGNPKHRILYCMLKKEFEFSKAFTKLDKESFGNNQTATYFGINHTTKDVVDNQVKVLYYNSEDDFAVKILTKQNDEVILAVGRNENNFLDIYNTITAETQNYIGKKYFTKVDELKVPYVKFDLKENITEVENKPFLFADGTEWSIYKALQTIQFELDEKGGKLKSEAGFGMMATAMINEDDPRYFYVDQAFTIFLVEEGEELPYFAAKISDIENIQ